MSKESTEFEIFISRIHRLLHNDDSIVTWNEKIPDPDNPSQARQIDISVRKNDLFNIIECRHHVKKQDVKWIEELIGRRASLNASSITAVSSGGFTKLAVIKARAHGVILSEIQNVSDEFVLSWTRGMDITVSFFRYNFLKMTLFVDPKFIKSVSYNELKKELLAGSYVHDFSPDNFDQNIFKGENFKCLSFKLNRELCGINVGGIPIFAVQVEGDVYLENMELTMPTHLAYIAPGSSVEESNVIIQKFNFGNTKVINNDNNIAVYLDLSQLNIPPYWKFCAFEMRAAKNTNELFTLLNAEVPYPLMYADDIDLNILSTQEIPIT